MRDLASLFIYNSNNSAGSLMGLLEVNIRYLYNKNDLKKSLKKLFILKYNYLSITEVAPENIVHNQ